MKTKQMVLSAILAAVASVVMLLEFPLPLLPPFLKIDFSLAIVTIGGLIVGPLAVVAIAIVKAFVAFFHSTSNGVGELADLIISISFALPFCYIYKKYSSNKGLVFGSIISIITIAIVGAIANIYILIPFYSKVMPFDAIIGMCKTVNPSITNLNTYVIFGVVPFNIIKGIIISIISIIVFKALKKR